MITTGHNFGRDLAADHRHSITSGPRLFGGNFFRHSRICRRFCSRLHMYTLVIVRVFPHPYELKLVLSLALRADLPAALLNWAYVDGAVSSDSDTTIPCPLF